MLKIMFNILSDYLGQAQIHFTSINKNTSTLEIINNLNFEAGTKKMNSHLLVSYRYINEC